MSRKFLIPLLAAAFLVAPAVLPSALVPAIAPGVSGTAWAAVNLNSSRSNNYRVRNPTPKSPGGAERMGGGGGGHSTQKGVPAQGSTPSANGITIHCPLQGSGDPMKGLNVDTSKHPHPPSSGCN